MGGYLSIDTALALLEEKKALQVQNKRLESEMTKMQAEFEGKLDKKLKEAKVKADKMLELSEREIDDLENEVKDLRTQLKDSKRASSSSSSTGGVGGLPASLSMKEENLVKEINQLKGFLNDAEKKLGKAKAVKMKMEMDLNQSQERIDDLLSSKKELEGKIRQLQKDVEQAKKVALLASSSSSSTGEGGGGGGGPDALRLLAQVQALKDRLEEEEEEKEELSRIQRDKLLSLEDEKEELEAALEEMQKKWLEEVDTRNRVEIENDKYDSFLLILLFSHSSVSFLLSSFFPSSRLPVFPSSLPSLPPSFPSFLVRFSDFLETTKVGG